MGTLQAANIRAADAAASSARAALLQPARPHTLLSFDLAGPKLRTGAIAPLPPIMSWHPQHDARGVHTSVAFVLLTHDGGSGISASPRTAVVAGVNGAGPGMIAEVVPLAQGGRELLEAALPGDSLLLHDARNKSVRLVVLAQQADGLLCGAAASAYVEEGNTVTLHPQLPQKLHHGAASPSTTDAAVAAPAHPPRDSIVSASVGPLTPPPGTLTLGLGDTISFVCGEGESHGPTGADTSFTIFIDIPTAVCAAVAVGHRVLLDDGKFAGVVQSVGHNSPSGTEGGSGSSGGSFLAVLTVVHGGTAKLGAEKGVNLPDTTLGLPALTRDDEEALAAVLPLHPDLIALSFVQAPADVVELQARLDAAGASSVGIVLKIETAAGFAALPSLLLAGMRRPGAFGIMLARGDLGVEVGFARMSEVQEELLWLCEAGHVPVIWATQVLESLAKSGIPTRGDVTGEWGVHQLWCGKYLGFKGRGV